MALTQITDNVWATEGPVSLGPGLRANTRKTVVRLEDGNLLIHSPVETTDELAAEIDALGKVSHLVAPNLFHHLFLEGALQRWPDARLCAPPGLAAKRSDLEIHQTLEPGEWLGCLDVFELCGMPRFQEFVFFHRPSGTLIATDLIFNAPHGHTVMARLFFRLAGTYQRLAMSRLFKGLIRDKKAFSKSVEPLLELPMERVIMAHGDVLEEDAAKRFRESVRGESP